MGGISTLGDGYYLRANIIATSNSTLDDIYIFVYLIVLLPFRRAADNWLFYSMFQSYEKSEICSVGHEQN